MGSAVASSTLAASLQVGRKAASLQTIRASTCSPANDMSLNAGFQAAIGLPSNVNRRDGLLAKADKLKTHSTGFYQVRKASAHKRKLEVSAVANAPSRTQIAASPALAEIFEKIVGKLPAASKTPPDLSKEALELALNAAVLSALAYKTPDEVEYLRQKAKYLRQKEAKGKKGVPAPPAPADLSKEELDDLEKEDKLLGYTDLLGQFEDAPADFFDGRNGLFVKTTEAYAFYCRTPEDQQDILYVVFRGTSEFSDFLGDLTALPVPVYQKQKDVQKRKDVQKQTLLEVLRKDVLLLLEVLLRIIQKLQDAHSLKLHCGFRDQCVAVSTALSKKVEAVISHHDEMPARPTEPLSKDSAPNAKAKLPSRIQDLHTVGVKNAGAEGVHMVFAGHSLGAAVAAIASFVAAKERVAGDKTTISYFGFGSPRVGNAAFAREYKNLLTQDQKSDPLSESSPLVPKGPYVYHFANEFDPVPGVPSPITFRHVTGGYVLQEGADLKSRLQALTRGPVMQEPVMSACVPKPLEDEADAGRSMAFARWSFAALKYYLHLPVQTFGGLIFRGKLATPWEEHDVTKYYVPRIRYLLKQAKSQQNVTDPEKTIAIGTAPAANGVQVA